MRIDARKFALAAAISAALLWMICSLIVIALPHQSMHVTGYMVHADLNQWQWDMHWSGLIGGLLAWSLLAGATAWLIAAVYNKLLGDQS